MKKNLPGAFVSKKCLKPSCFNFFRVNDGGRKKFCSISCCTSHHKSLLPKRVKPPVTRKKQAPVVRTCPGCECIFEVAYSYSRKRYCTPKCRKQHGRADFLKLICECCGNSYEMSRTQLNSRNGIARFCSQKCETDFLRGANSPAFKGGRYICERTGDVMVQIQGKDVRTGQNNLYKALKRLVAEEYIGRSLMKSECVLHVDTNKQNNDPSNLFICSIGFTRSIFRYKTQPLPLKGNLDKYKQEEKQHENQTA